MRNSLINKHTAKTLGLSLSEMLESIAPTEAQPASSTFTNWAFCFQTQLVAVLLLPSDGHYSPAPEEIVFIDNILKQLFTFLLN